MKNKDSRILVGHYRIGIRPIRLYVDSDSEGGSVFLTPKDKGPTAVHIGIDCPFEEAIAVLLHEIYELSLIDLNTRYRLAPSYSTESSDFLFVVTHNQLGEAHERIGEFLVKASNDFGRAYKKYKRKKGKK